MAERLSQWGFTIWETPIYRVIFLFVCVELLLIIGQTIQIVWQTRRLRHREWLHSQCSARLKTPLLTAASEGSAMHD
ncbi:MAG: hypothetical protein WC889_15465, partial [Myxococcota bacterium]